MGGIPQARRGHGGYGAGIDSPGWYGHLFAAPDRPVDAMADQGGGPAPRDEDRIVSSAHVIEAVRLAETLVAGDCAAARCPA
ncbi:DUF5682 family protein [Streptomyces shaanxiensis]